MLDPDARRDVRARNHAGTLQSAVLELPRDLVCGPTLAVHLQPAGAGVGANGTRPDVVLIRSFDVCVEPLSE